MHRDHVNKTGFQTAVTVLLLFLFQRAASIAGAFAADRFHYGIIDHDNMFVWISLHHLFQMLPAILIICYLSHLLKIRFGFGIGNKITGLKYTAAFSGCLFIYVILSYVIGYASGNIPAGGELPGVTSMIGTLAFQLLLSGTSEEILFRALSVTVLFYVNKSHIRLGKIKLTAAVMLSAGLFSAAHVDFAFSPVSVKADLFQLVYAFVLGIIYGITYEKTKSVLYPALMHGISNFLMVGAGYIVTYLTLS